MHIKHSPSTSASSTQFLPCSFESRKRKPRINRESTRSPRKTSPTTVDTQSKIHFSPLLPSYLVLAPRKHHNPLPAPHKRIHATDLSFQFPRKCFPLRQPGAAYIVNNIQRNRRVTISTIDDQGLIETCELSMVEF